MKKLIIIKYGELSTKKDNIRFFLKTLCNNIEVLLEGIDHSIEYDSGRMFIFSSDLDAVLNKVKLVFGIHKIIIGYEYDTKDINSLENNLKELIKDKEITSFKVETKRSDKTYELKSMDINKRLGSLVLKNVAGSFVDVHNPSTLINIEIRKNKSYIYFESYNGLGGYPVGVQGKGILMLSGGIDSPVAGYLAMKRGIKLEAVYFESPPHTSEAAKEKVKSLARVLSNYSSYVKIHVINFTEIQETIYKNCPHDYLITLMRRCMYRITERLARRNNCKAIINGESVGQVASQTLTSMMAINETIKTPVIRPVACLDKLEIIDIAKAIDTYDTSILPYEDCCTIFVPKHPVINPDINKCIEYEKLFDFESLIKNAIYNEEIIKVTPNDNKFDDLL